MILAEALGTGQICFLIMAVGMALAFEFVNGFHDTANAVATVIYTNTLRPWVAVIWSGLWNLLGVMASRGGVAFAILALLPVDLVLDVGSTTGFAMVFALLISAILWNVGTWYLGLPASSSHALVGSIMGVGLASAWVQGKGSWSDGVNWAEVAKVMTSLVVSPIVGFVLSALLLLAMKVAFGNGALFKAPPKGVPPPRGIRALLVLTCTGVSFGHGSNDGQKGMGLMLLILVGILPGTYALRPETDPAAMHRLAETRRAAQVVFERRAAGAARPPADAAIANLESYLKAGKASGTTFASLAVVNGQIGTAIAGRDDFDGLTDADRKALRSQIFVVASAIGRLDAQGEIREPADHAVLLGGAGDGATAYREQLDARTKFIPLWVKAAVALSLGLGTMIGWKRIVVTVGEKIGKEHLTYGQGAAAELVAAATILSAEFVKLPVSTTHVLSSGIAGTMAANRSGLQVNTLRNLLLAWVLTLPVCMMLGAATFAAGVFVVLNNLLPVAIAVVGVGVAIAGVRFARARMRRVRPAPTRRASEPSAK